MTRESAPHRRFVRPLLLALAAAGTLAGCGGDRAPAPGPEPAASASAPAGEQAVRGGTLVIARPEDSSVLDPADVFEGESTKVVGQIFDGLVNFAPGSTEIEPGLATSWESSPDGRVITFELRRGVRFHDGSPFDAAAVVFSIERQRDPSHPFHDGQFNTWENTFAGQIRSVEAVDPLTVRVTLNEPFAPILSGFAVYSMAIVSPTAFERAGSAAFDSRPVGTGPFRLQEWVRGERVVLAANDDYWAGRPPLDEVIFRAVPEAAERARLLAAGEVHVAENLSLADLNALQADANVVVRRQPGLNTSYMALNTTREPFTDPRVRRAVALAAGMPMIARTIVQDLGVPAKNYLPPTLWGTNDKVPAYDHDPARARRLLEEAGHPEGISFTLDVMRNSRSYLPEPMRAALAIQSRLREAGIEVTLRENDWQDHLDRVVRGPAGDYDSALLGWMADMPDPNDFLYVQFHSSNAELSRPHQNIALYRNPTVDRLVEEAQRTLDRDRRAELYREVQAIVHEDVPIIPIAHGFITLAHRREVQGLEVNVASSNYGLQKTWLRPAGDEGP